MYFYIQVLTSIHTRKMSYSKKNILVFPCGSEVALEIYRSLKNDIHFHLIGASSVEDHGKFVFEDYIGGLPYVTDSNFLSVLVEIVKTRKIDAIYPAMDMVISVIKKAEDDLPCKVIASSKETVDICLSKRKTYETLQGIVKVPFLYSNYNDDSIYPVFCKYDVGYGSRGAEKVRDYSGLLAYKKDHCGSIVCEYLSGEEYTVDCLTNKYGDLLFVGARTRGRVSNGISVNTKPCDNKEFLPLVEAINKKINFRGAWFAQFKRDKNGVLTLLEIAARLGGSSSLYRAQGVNFASLSIYDTFDVSISILNNDCTIEMDRSLDNVYKIDIEYDEVYCDYDDCCVLEEKMVNTDMVGFLYKCINQGKKVTLLTRHDKGLDGDIKRMRLEGIFDSIITISDNTPKAKYIKNLKSIFIDDSFSERKNVHDSLGIPVFGVDMIKYL